ncbi:unnamed protein product, partial [Polarella glacialis]
VLASRRRDIGDAAGHRCVRLWVEDVPCPSASSAPSFSGARLHALDEITGQRAHRDIADAMLTTLLASFRKRQDSTSDSEDIDDFLHALLGEVHVAVTHQGFLELQLPSLERGVDVGRLEEEPGRHFVATVPGWIIRPQTTNMTATPNY